MSGRTSEDDDDLDVEARIELCDGFAYAGLHQVVAGTSSVCCYCDDIYGRYGLAPKQEECNLLDSLDVYMTREKHEIEEYSSFRVDCILL